MDAQIEELSQASSDDEAVLSLPVPDRIYGFHAQQVIEKQLKMLILGHRRRHAFIHDISALRNVVKDLGETLPPIPFQIDQLTEFAGVFRYSTPRSLTPVERDQILETVHILREYVHARLVALNA
jgi:HEPN domain-containing protein